MKILNKNLILRVLLIMISTGQIVSASDHVDITPCQGVVLEATQQALLDKFGGSIGAFTGAKIIDEKQDQVKVAVYNVISDAMLDVTFNIKRSADTCTTVGSPTMAYEN